MAKQLGIIQFKGKLGDIVGAKRSAGQKSNTLRVRVREIANPKTTAQIKQRMRLLPAVNFYRMLQHVLNHSYQGTQYKAPSYNEFMRLALKNDDFPYVVKGETLPIPGAYQISKGSLPSVNVLSVLDSGVVFDLYYDDAWGDGEATIGDVCTQWITGGAPIQNGDQLTFILVSCDDGSIYGSRIFYQTAALVINTQSTERFNLWLTRNQLLMTGQDSKLKLFRDNTAGDFYAAAGAVIVSRPPSSAGGAWMRSNTSMFVKPAILIETRSTAAYQLAFDSYGEGAQVLTSDWYLNQSRARYANAASYLFSAAYQQGNVTLANALYYNNAGAPMLVVSVNREGGVTYIFDGTTAQPTSLELDAALTHAITLAEVRNIFPDLIVSDEVYQAETPDEEEGGDEIPQP